MRILVVLQGRLIRGKVAQVLNSKEVALNLGSEQGIRLGMQFDIVDPKGEDIRDPDTGDVLGSLERPKVRVRVVSVLERMSVASTFRRSKINIGGTGMAASMLAQNSLARHLLPPTWVTHHETLKTSETTWEDLDETQSYVKIGDPVVQVAKDQMTPVEDELG